MQGAQECTLSADAELAATTVRQAWSRPPIELDFSGGSRFVGADDPSRHVYSFGIVGSVFKGV